MLLNLLNSEKTDDVLDGLYGCIHTHHVEKAVRGTSSIHTLHARCSDASLRADVVFLSWHVTGLYFPKWHLQRAGRKVCKIRIVWSQVDVPHTERTRTEVQQLSCRKGKAQTKNEAANNRLGLWPRMRWAHRAKRRTRGAQKVWKCLRMLV